MVLGKSINEEVTSRSGSPLHTQKYNTEIKENKHAQQLYDSVYSQLHSVPKLLILQH